MNDDSPADHSNSDKGIVYIIIKNYIHSTILLYYREYDE